MKLISIFLLLALVPLNSISAPREKSLTPSKPEKISEEEAPTSTQVWLAPPAAFFVGFGLGHAIQNRLKGPALLYPAFDALGFLLVISSMGSCRNDCSGKKETYHKIGLGTLIVSRIFQVVDVTVWSGRNLSKLSFSVAPDGQAKSALALVNYSF